ncbi:uncharacterized protein LOC127286206 [Leptopilina boulardi]|uniref:uncharacterized protein LOC127286206 n=1 Tax=Leptopilina boulardi TaxID=63433 RepID=UPI0021F58B57|nr:uncharacterized protein LOC127286206 [Leptopilina boulardi]
MPSSQFKNLQKQKNILGEIAKASEAIRRKHRLIKLGKEEIEQSLNTTFKPIVTPIQKLADEFEIIKHIRPQKIEVKNEQDFKQEDIIDPGFNNFYASSEIKNEQDDEMSFKTASLDDNKKKKDMDNTYGVRKLAKGRLMIGDSPINFEENNIIINNSVYHATKGLLELLFKKTPQENFISFDDRENYANIVISTNAHKKYYKSDENIRENKTLKFQNFIAKKIPSPKSEKKRQGKGIVPQYMINQENTNIDYIYWDDPNELVDRLRLLLASQAAGNPSHNNEIISIIEELREAKIIY